MNMLIHVFILVTFLVKGITGCRIFNVNNPFDSTIFDSKIPLQSIQIQGDIIDFIGKVTIRQKYLNDYDTNIEAKYQLNLPETATVTKMSMVIGNRVLNSTIQEKAEARENYEQAIRESKTTGLLEKASNGIYSMNVGNIGVKEQIEIVLEYLTELEATDKGEMKFILPTNIFPKYSDGSHQTVKDMIANKDTTSHLVHSSNVGYVFNIDLTWTSNSRIKEVRSFSNEIEVTGIHAKRVHIQSKTVPSRGDFNIFVRTAEVVPTVYSHTPEKSSDTYLMMVQRIPDRYPDELEAGEYIIVVDRSGSMDAPMMGWSGNRDGSNRLKIDYARDAVKLFVESLPAGSKFNVVSFGSSYQKMFAQSVPYTEENKKSALALIDGFSANFGGTELFACLSDLLTGNGAGDRRALSPGIDLNKRQWKADEIDDTSDSNKPLKKPFTQKTIVLLTDGEVSNTDAVLSLVGEYSHKARIFSIGIGQDVHRHLVNGIAKASNAQSEILIDNPDIDTVVAKMMDSSSKSFYRSTSLKLNNQILPLHKPIYPNNFGILFAKVSREEYETMEKVEVSALDGLTGEKVEWVIPLDKSESDLSMTVLPQLYAADRIRQLSKENQYNSKTESMIRLSVDYQVMSEYTSFLVIDEETRVNRQGQFGGPRVVDVPQFGGSAVLMRGGMKMGLGGNSVNPSPCPSVMPSSQPSASPSAMPSGVPTGSPAASSSSRRPTSVPSGSPSSAPSGTFSSVHMSGGGSVNIATGASLGGSGSLSLSTGAAQTGSSGSILLESMPADRMEDQQQQTSTATPTPDALTALFRFKTVAGSFTLSSESVAVAGLSHDRIVELSKDLGLSEELIFNLQLLHKFRSSTNTSKFVMIIRNLERWLEGQLRSIVHDSSKGLEDWLTSAVVEKK
jgi:Ca-activated chloride channel family protein